MSRCQRRPIYYFFSEGKKNQTERLYFRNFNHSLNYSIRFVNSNETDPEGLLSFAKKYLKRNAELSDRIGDRVFILCDIDNEEKRQKIVSSGLVDRAKKSKMTFVFSNPCFEIWFLNHFTFTRKEYTSLQLLNDLKKYLKEYEKNVNYFDELQKRTVEAIKNSKHQYDNAEMSVPPCPGTNVFEVVELLLRRQ